MRGAGRLASALVLLASGPLAAQEPGRACLAFSAGQYNVADQSHAAGEGGLQWRRGGPSWVPRPIAGGMVTHQGAFNLYLGFTLDLPLGRRLALRPSFAPGYYRRGGGKDLGHPLEFRSGLEVGWRFAGGTRVGVELYHLSNASLSDRNPGENSLVLVVAIPAPKRAGR